MASQTKTHPKLAMTATPDPTTAAAALVQSNPAGPVVADRPTPNQPVLTSQATAAWSQSKNVMMGTLLMETDAIQSHKSKWSTNV